MPGDEITIQVGVELDTKNINEQLSSITKGKDNKISLSINENTTAQINNLKKTIDDISKTDHQINFHIDQRILNDLQGIIDGLNNGLAQIGTKAAQQAQQMTEAAMRQAQQQTNQAAKQIENLGNLGKTGSIPSSGAKIIDVESLREADDLIKKIQSGPWNGDTKFTPTTEIDKYNSKLGETITVIKQLNEEQSELAGRNVYDITAKTIETNYQKIEQEAQKMMNYIQKQETEFDKLYTKAFEQDTPLSGAYADEALKALQKYQDGYTEIAKSGSIATDEQKRKMAELRQETILTIETQKKLQQTAGREQVQDFKGLFDQSKEWETALKNITDAENKLNDIQKNAFSGTNALTGDFAKEATRQIEEVKTKFAEIRQAAEQSFDGAAGVSKDSLTRMVENLKADLDRLAKLEYPSDKLAAQNVDVKKAFAADTLAEMEEKLKNLGESTTEYYNRVQDLKTLLSSVGQVDSDPSAWANFRNELHKLQDDIKKFENSTQGMGQKLASGIEAGQLQQITDAIEKLNNISVDYSGAGVENVQQNLQSLAIEYQNVIDQLRNPDLSQDQFDTLTNKIKELNEQLKQAADKIKIFNGGIKNDDALAKYNLDAENITRKFEQLQEQYENLARTNPDIARRFEEVKDSIDGMDPTNVSQVSREVTNLGRECAAASGQSKGLRGALQDAFGGFGSYISRFVSSFYLITKTVQSIKKMVNEVKAVDSSLAELQKVTDMTGVSLEQFIQKAYSVGEGLGRTGQDVMDAVTTFSRAGYDLKEATELAQSALVMTNVGVDISSTEAAASDMISIMKAFDIQAEESMAVIDKLYNVSNKEPLDFGNITQMLVTAGGTLAQTGTSLEQTMGLLTGAFATMRDTSVANGLIMISQRLRGVKEDGEAIEEAGFMPKLKEMFSNVGIDIEDSNGELRSTYDILNDLAAVWDQLSSKQRQYFGEKIAGNRQVKTLNAIMQNWDVVSDTIDKANNAQDAAIKGNEIYMNTIEGRMNQLKSAFQELAMATINSNFIKSYVDIGTELTKFTTSIGGLVPVLTTVIGLLTIIKSKAIADGIKAIAVAFTNMITGAAGASAALAGWVGAAIAVVGIVAAVVSAINNANNSMQRLSDAKKVYDDQANKVSELNTKLEDTKDLMRELTRKESNGTISVVEQTELDRLRELNTELENNIRLEEGRAEVKSRKTREEAVKAAEDYKNAKDGLLDGRVVYDTLGREGILRATGTERVEEYGGSYIPQLGSGPLVNQESLLLAIEGLRVAREKYNEELKNTENAILYNPAELQKWEDRKNIFESTIEEYITGLEGIIEGVPVDESDEAFMAVVNLITKLKELLNEGFNELSADEQLNGIISKYPDAVKKIMKQISEAGEAWELQGDDAGLSKLKETHEKISEELGNVVGLLDQVDSITVTRTLGDILKEVFMTGEGAGNVDVLNRKILKGSDMLDKWREDFEGFEDDMVTYFSQSQSIDAGELQVQVTVTPIDQNGNRLSQEELNNYIDEIASDSSSIDELMAKDKAGKSLILHYTPVIEGDWETAIDKEDIKGKFLHELSAVYDSIRNGDFATAGDYFKDMLANALADPSIAPEMVQQVWDIFDAVANAMAQAGDTRLKEAIKDIDFADMLLNSMSLRDVKAEDVVSVDGLISDLKSKLGWTADQIGLFFKQAMSKSIQTGNAFDVHLDDVKIYNTTEAFKTLTAAINEQNKAGVLSAETWKNLINSEDAGLKGLTDCLELTADGYRLNTEKVNEYIAAMQDEQSLKITKAIEERTKKLKELIDEYNNLVVSGADAADIQAKQDEIDGINAQIAQFVALQREIEASTSALARYNAAKSTPNQDENHSQGTSIYKDVQEKYKEGKVGTDDFKEGMGFLLGDDWLKKANGNVEEAYKNAKKIGERYFSGNDAKDADNFSNDLVKKGFAQWTEGENGPKLQMLTNDLSTIAEAFGISEDAAQSLFELLNSYSVEDQITFDDTISSAEELAQAEQKLAEVQQQRAEVEERLKALESQGMQGTEEYAKAQQEVSELTKQEEDLSSAIDTAKESMGSMDEMTLEQALAEIEKLQQAITTLQENNIEPTVTMSESLKQLIDLVTNLNKLSGKKIELPFSLKNDGQTPVGSNGVTAPGEPVELPSVLIIDAPPKVDESVEVPADLEPEKGEGIEWNEDPVEVPVEPEQDWKQAWLDALYNTPQESIEVPIEADDSDLSSQVDKAAEEASSGEEIEIPATAVANEVEVEETEPVEVPVDPRFDKNAWPEDWSEELPEPPEIPVKADTGNIPEEIEGAVESANPDTQVTVTENIVRNDTTGGLETPETVTQTVNADTSGAASQISSLQNEASAEETMSVSADTSSGERKVDALAKKAGASKTMPVGADTSSADKKVDELIKKVTTTQKMTVEVTYKETNKPPSGANQKNARGTKHANKGPSLVDEEGAELIEHRKTGTFELGTNNGPRITRLDSGDIVHTAEETKKILSRYGSIRNFIKGGLDTAKGFFGNAFVSGSTDAGWKKALEDQQKGGTGKGGKKSGSSGDGDKDDDDFKKWAEKLFDWVEIRLERLKSLTTTWLTLMEDAVSAASKNKYLESALKSVQDQIKATTKAYYKYMKTAEAVARKGGLSEDIIKKIQNGSIDITKYDKETQEKIKEYQEWYEKALKCTEALRELKQQERELAEQKLDNIAKEYDNRIKIYEARLSKHEAERDYNSTYGEGTKGATLKQKKDGTYKIGSYGDYEKDIKIDNDIISEMSSERASLEKELKNLMKAGLVREGDDTWQKYQEKLKELDKTIIETQKHLQDLKKEAVDTSISKIDWGREKLENDTEQREKQRQLGRARGTVKISGDVDHYNSLIANTQGENNALRQENDVLRARRDELNIDSEEYKELTRQIRENEKAILDNELQIESYNDAIRQIDFTLWGNVVSRLKDEAGALNDEIDRLERHGTSVDDVSRKYEELINNADRQIEFLTRQKNKYIELMGTVEEGSEKWYEYAAAARRCDAEIRGLQASQEEWQDSIDNAPLQKMQWNMEKLADDAEKLDHSVSLKQARGQAVTSQDYQTQIDNAASRRWQLQAENDFLRGRQAGMSQDSKEWQELEKQIRDNEKEMRDLELSTEEWKDSIIQIDLQKFEDTNHEFEHTKDLLTNTIKLNDAVGGSLKNNIDTYQQLISNSKAYVNSLQSERQYYVNLLNTVEKGSDKYREYLKRIEEIDKATQDATISQAEWTKAIRETAYEILEFGIENSKFRGESANYEDRLLSSSGKNTSPINYYSEYYALGESIKQQEEYLNTLYSDLNKYQYGSKEYINLTKKIHAAEKQLWEDRIKYNEMSLELTPLGPLELLNKQADQSIGMLKDEAEIIESRKTGGYGDILDNSQLIANFNTQRHVYEATRDRYTELMGKVEKGSEKWYEYAAAVAQATKEIINLDKETANLEAENFELNFALYDRFLNNYRAEEQEISDRVSLHQSQGAEETAQTYENLINNGMEQISILGSEISLLEERLSQLTPNTPEYDEIVQRIREARTEINAIMVSQEEWNDAILDLGISNIQKYKESIEKINEELERRKELQEAIQDVEKASSQRKVRTYVEGVGFVFKADQDELKSAQEKLESVIRNQLLGRMDDLIKALEEEKDNQNVYDANGNLIGQRYTTPQIGSLIDVLSNYLTNNNGIDLGVLRDAFGSEAVSGVSTTNNSISLDLGGITINEVNDGNDLAVAIINQLPNAIIQALYQR